MKNMKIKNKMLVAFGAIIVLMLIFTAVVIASTTDLVKNVEEMRTEMHILGSNTQFINSFSMAYTSAQKISISYDEAEYGNLVKSIEDCKNLIREIKETVSEKAFLHTFLSQMDTISANLDSWEKNAFEAKKINDRLTAVIEHAREDQRALNDLSMGILNYQIAVSLEEAGQDLDEETRVWRINRVEQGADIGLRLLQIGSAFEVMFESLDTSEIDKDMAYFNETHAFLEEFRDTSILQYNIDTATAMLKALDVYKENISNLTALLSQRANNVSALTAMGSQVRSGIFALAADMESSSLLNAGKAINASNMAMILIAIISLIGFVTAVTLALYISSLISKPVLALSAFFEKAGVKGDIMVTAEEDAYLQSFTKNRDEMGQLIKNCGAYIYHLMAISKNLDSIADGDFSIDSEMLSDADTVGQSLKKLLSNLNNLFGTVNTSAYQVSAGAKQIADGAQNLAQGATEQAASVDELSNSFVHINELAKNNLSLATEALDEMQQAGSLMGVCTDQMAQMLMAMKTIDEKSKEILKTTKVIDDIAFQTNILALNAAVEAARAGQHGKGFAVVAEEVRNLASKSAEAAKETSVLLESSSQSVQEGNEIVGKVNGSLQSVVEISAKNADKIANVQSISASQSEAMEQVTVNIGQVAQVVQHNSATAQESAASAEEMSSQSMTLQDLVSQFKLKGGSSPQYALPASGKPARKGAELPRKAAAPSAPLAFEGGAGFGKY